MIKKRITPLMDADKAKYIDEGMFCYVKLTELDISEDNSYDIDAAEGALKEELLKIKRTMKYCYENQCNMVIYNYASDQIFIQNYADDFFNVYCYSMNRNEIIYLDITISEDNFMQFLHANELLVTEDNVKTLFGDKSIIGQGNIDLYRHNLEISNGTATVYVTIYSSNNLVCDSLQDLTTVLKPTNLTGKYGWGTGYMIYTNGIWKMTVSGEQLSNVTKVHDYVSAI